jgi:plasmid maintenance system killer protein
VLVLTGSRKEAIEAYRNYLRTRKTPSQYDDVIKRKIEMLERSPGEG